MKISVGGSDLPTSHETSPFSLERGSASTCIIGNGVPKSGTHLLSATLKHLGTWKPLPLFMAPNCYRVSRGAGEAAVEHTLFNSIIVRKVRNGQFLAGHMFWHPEIEKALVEESSDRTLRHLFIYRDPRDCLISYLRMASASEFWRSRREPNAREQDVLRALPDDDARLSYVLEKMPAEFQYRRYEGWLRSSNAHAVRFEDLYPEVCDAKNGRIGPTLAALLRYLGVDVASVDAVAFHDAVNGKSKTASDVQDKVGQFRRMYKEHHYRILDNPGFRSTLDAFGYAW